MRMGRQDMAQKIMRQVLHFQGKGKYGGFFGGEKEVIHSPPITFPKPPLPPTL